MGWSGARGRTWVYPAVGVSAAVGLTLVPSLPFGAQRWPAEGIFGAFTWAAWLISTALALTLGLLAGRLMVFRPRHPSAGEGGRVLRTAAGFALLAVLAYLTAARAAAIERYPSIALGLALAGLLALRLLTRAVTRMAPGDETFPDNSHRADDTKPAPRATRPARAVGVEADREDDEAEPADSPPRWVGWLATLAAVLLVLVVALGTAVRWLGPGLGLVLTAERPTPIFWGETAFFEYDAHRRAGKTKEPYLVPPEAGTPAAVRRGVLAVGTRLVIKGLVENGVEVRVEHDPNGRLAGEWGYVRLNDLTP